ncbi:MAG: tetratricopeptide repeat protein [Candidatus Hodarchaeota archaeon]
MFPFVHDSFGFLQEIIHDGNYDTALDKLKELKKGNTLENQELLTLKFLQVYLYILSGQFIKSLKLAEELNNLTKSFQYPLQRFDALMLKAEALRHLGKFIGAESLRHPCIYSEILPENLPVFYKLVDQCELEFNGIEITESPDYILRKAWLYRSKGVMLRTKKEYDRSHQFLLKSIEFFKHADNIEGLAGAYSSLALSYGIQGNISKEIECLEKSLKNYQEVGLKREIADILLRLGILLFHYQSKTQLGFQYVFQSYQVSKSIKDVNGVSVALGHIGNLYTWQGELNRAFKFLQRSLLLSERIGNTENLAFTLNNIGWNCHIRGEINLALEPLNRSLSISREKQYPWILIWVLYNLGFVKQAQGKFDEACGYYTQSINISKEIVDYFAHSWGLYLVIKLTMDTESTSHSKLHMDHLENLSKQYKIHLMSQMYRVAQGMLLKRSPRLRDKAKAQELFDEITSEEVEAVEITADAMINKCELLLFEYKNSGDSAVFQDVRELTNQLLDIAQDQNSHSLLSETYLLKAELALLQGNVHQARKYISQGQTIAEEKGLHKLALAISREHDNLLDQLGTIGALKSHDDITADPLEIDNVEDLLERMTTRQITAVSEITPEDPIMLLVIAEGGMTLFNKRFVSKEVVKEQLVGSFLSAIELFSKEVFSSSIERMKLGEYRLVMQGFDKITFSYIFKGESYPAIKRLKRFIQALGKNSTLWEALKSKTETGTLLKADEKEVINNILENAFI